jgi:putative flippase GtrA
MSVQPMTDSIRALNALLCNIGGFCVSNVFCYILNRLFVFKPGKHHIFLEFLLFFGVSAISLAVAAGVQTLLIRYLAMQTTYAFGANILCALFINYATRKFIIFKG